MTSGTGQIPLGVFIGFNWDTGGLYASLVCSGCQTAIAGLEDGTTLRGMVEILNTHTPTCPAPKWVMNKLIRPRLRISEHKE